MSTSMDDIVAEWGGVLVTDPTPDIVPDGWATLEEIARGLNIGIATASRKMRDALAAGKVERKRFRLMRGGRPLPVPHYRVVKNGGDGNGKD